MDSQARIITSQSPIQHVNSIKKIVKSIQLGDPKPTISSVKAKLESLNSFFKQDRYAHPLLKMIWATGKYLLNANEKSPAHPAALPLLNSLVQALENLVGNPTLDASEKEGIFSNEFKKFNIFKDKIAGSPSLTGNLSSLNAILLSMDWEIDDQTMKNFEITIDALKSSWKSDQVRIAFLDIIKNLGNYIFVKRADAHAETISFMNSIFKNLETIDRTPAMPYGQQKEILRGDINRFHEFKKKISQTSKSNQPPENKVILKTRPIDEDNDFTLQPALSHLKQSQTDRKQTDDTAATLITLPSDSDRTDDQAEELFTLRSNNQKEDFPPPSQPPPPPPRRDIMGDLFSPKESEMDDLLEEIHRVNFQGVAHEHVSEAPKKKKSSVPPGMQEFIPTRLDVEPIPEIGNTLDNFFGSSPSDSTQISTKAFEPPGANEEIHLPEEIHVDEDAIVPYEDEYITPALDSQRNAKESESEEINDIQDLFWDDQSLPILERIHSSLQEKITENPTFFDDLNEEIIKLEQIWDKEPEQKIIIQILNAFNESLQKTIKASITPPDSNTKTNPPGFWSRLKNIFGFKEK